MSRVPGAGLSCGGLGRGEQGQQGSRLSRGRLGRAYLSTEQGTSHQASSVPVVQ